MRFGDLAQRHQQRGRVVEFQRRKIPRARDLPFISQSDMRVNRGFAGHGNGALGQCGNRGIRDVRGRNAGLPPADQHAKADIGAFGPLGLFQLARPNVDRQRRARHRKRIRPTRPFRPDARRQVLLEV